MSSSTAEPLWQTFFPENPYAGFPLEAWEPDLQGWGSSDAVFARLIELVRPELIVEVGSWKCGSAINMAQLTKAAGLRTSIVCVDTWLGSPEHFFKRDHPAYWDSLRVRYGFPHIYEQFMANVLDEGHSDVIVPLPQTSDNGAVILRQLKLKADLLYIDAAHSYTSALADLRNYWPVLKPTGALLGDDWSHGPVARAATTFAAEREAELLVSASGRKYAMAGRDRHGLPGLERAAAG